MSTELTFSSRSFQLFAPDLQRDPIHNAARLEIRRKLDAFGKRLGKHLAADDLAFASRASLHHPYRFNAYKVQSQFVYLSRAPKERKHLKSILGVELGKDLDQNYVHVNLALQIEHDGLTLALRIHQNAWWDGENFKRQAKTDAGRATLCEAIRPAAGFGLRIHDHKSVAACESMEPDVLKEKLGYYTPGEQWLHVEKVVPKNDAWITEPGLEGRATEAFESLVPLYRAIRWTPENNFLFDGS